MKQSMFDKWLTTDPREKGVWCLVDEIFTKQYPPADQEICSCYGWDEIQKSYTENHDCEIHGETK